MYFHRSDHSRQYTERRHWNGDDEHWGKQEAQRNSHPTYGASLERTSRSREYSDSPRRQYSKDSTTRERRRKSPLRRRVSSPDWGASDTKRRRLTEDEDDYKYRHLAQGKTSRQLSLGSANVHPSTDVKHEKDFESWKNMKSSSHRHHHEEFVYRKRHEDDISTPPSGYNDDRDDRARTWDHARERTQYQDDSMKNQERDGAHQNARLPDNSKSSKGFQLFLDVLNKGVNVATLTKIMTSAKEDSRPQTLTSHPNTEDQPSPPRSAGREPEFRQNPNRGSEDAEFWRTSSSERPHKSLSTPKENFLSEEWPVRSCDEDQIYPSSSGCPGSLAHLDKTRLTPEEEHKHKQAQHILQAIGMNIEFEELGQMSHRIQERLYGKKDSYRGRPGRWSRERETMRGLSPILRNRSSSSSRSSYSPSPQKSDNSDSRSFQRGGTEKQHNQSIDYGQNSSSDILQGSSSSDVKSRENISTCRAYPQSFTYTLPESCPVPAMPTYSPGSSPGLPFPAHLPNLSQPRPQLCFPHMPPYPQPPPVNAFPAVLAQMRPLFPPPFGNPSVQPLNPPQKSKPLSRPRCLQVIETKQPG